MILMAVPVPKELMRSFIEHLHPYLYPGTVHGNPAECGRGPCEHCGDDAGHPCPGSN